MSAESLAKALPNGEGGRDLNETEIKAIQRNLYELVSDARSRLTAVLPDTGGFQDLLNAALCLDDTAPTTGWVTETGLVTVTNNMEQRRQRTSLVDPNDLSHVTISLFEKGDRDTDDQRLISIVIPTDPAGDININLPPLPLLTS